jgi:hypothetical protein
MESTGPTFALQADRETITTYGDTGQAQSAYDHGRHGIGGEGPGAQSMEEWTSPQVAARQLYFRRTCCTTACKKRGPSRTDAPRLVCRAPSGTACMMMSHACSRGAHSSRGRAAAGRPRSGKAGIPTGSYCLIMSSFCGLDLLSSSMAPQCSLGYCSEI